MASDDLHTGSLGWLGSLPRSYEETTSPAKTRQSQTGQQHQQIHASTNEIRVPSSSQSFRRVSEAENDTSPVIMDWDAPFAYEGEDTSSNWDVSLTDSGISSRSPSPLPLSDSQFPLSMAREVSAIFPPSPSFKSDQSSEYPLPRTPKSLNPNPTSTINGNLKTTCKENINSMELEGMPSSNQLPSATVHCSTQGLSGHSKQVVSDQVTSNSDAPIEPSSSVTRKAVPRPSPRLSQGFVPHGAHKITRPRPMDVVCTKHRTTFKNPGNVFYRQIIAEKGECLAREYLAKYSSDSRLPPHAWMCQKSRLAKEIVDIIRQRGGLFLFKSKKSTYFWDIGDSHAHRKTNKLLEKAAKEYQEAYKTGNFSGLTDPHIVRKLNQLSNADEPSLDEALKLLTIPPKLTNMNYLPKVDISTKYSTSKTANRVKGDTTRDCRR